MKYIVYSTEVCSKCKQLESILRGWGVEFESVDMATPEALTELRVNGVFTLTAPVLQMDDEFYTVDDIFDGEMIKDLEKMGLRR